MLIAPFRGDPIVRWPLRSLVGRLITLGLIALSPAAAGDPALGVAKTPTCGCCAAWVEHLENNAFEVTAHNVSHRPLNAIKNNLDITPDQASCHTAVVDGYFIEGHGNRRAPGR